MVVLVDDEDREIGRAPKLEAHRAGWLHRAVSVVLFNSAGEMLLQRRAAGKYHSGGLWANTCCSHPHAGETAAEAAVRRLREEMGLAARLRYAGRFRYRAEVGGGLCEHEWDHVFVGWSDARPDPDPEEVEAWRYASPETIRGALQSHPERFAAWFRILVDKGLRA